jgi:hypothetical protein
MDEEIDPEYSRKMIDSLIKIQEDILKIPELSIKHIDDIKRLRQGSDVLRFQTNDAKIKLVLVDLMNSMN